MSGDTAHGVDLDVNGDGYSDVAVAAPGGARVEVYYGSATGVSATPGVILRPPGGVAAGIASVGDVNGDGFGDLAVAEASGALFSVFGGSTSGLSSTTLSRVSVASWAGSGSNVFALGDVNGDGYADVAASIFDADNDGFTANGIAFVFHGGRSALASAPAWTARGAESGANLGRSIAGAGDIDGDRLADLVIARPGVATTAGPRSGAISVYRGRTTGVAMIASQTIDGTQSGARFGSSLSLLGSVDGDGFSELVVGAPESVESAMSFAGRATVFTGSGAGLETGSPVVVVGSPTGYRFGTIVRAAGDLNGDGFNDVAIGASMVGAAGAGGAGAVSVHLGSAVGTRIAAARVLAGAQSNEFFGSAIASPGDCNGDGFADLVIGSKGASPGGLMGAGSATLWLGSAAGISAVSARSFNGSALNEEFGSSLAQRNARTTQGLPRSARCGR
jgi:hypothetical protein